MKKIFTILAAMLLAITASATGTDFAAPGYKCAAADAVLSGTAGSSKIYLDESTNPKQIAFNDISISKTAIATWNITATRGCYVSVALEVGTKVPNDESSNKHIFDVKIFDSEDFECGHLSQGSDHAGANTTEAFAGTILIPTAGDYRVEIHHNRDWCKGSIQNVVLTYAADAPTIVRVENVTLDSTALHIDVYETKNLHATVSPNEATFPTVKWTSSNSSIATVDDNGAVKGIAAGTATITATADGKSASCSVTVSADIPSTDFSTPYFLKGSKAQTSGKVKYNETDSLYYNDNDPTNNLAIWRIHALNAGRIQATINYKSGAQNSGHLLKVVILDDEDNRVGDTLSMAEKKWTPAANDVVLPSSVLLPAAGDYTIKLINTVQYSGIKLRGITLGFVARPSIKFLGGIIDDWVEHSAEMSADRLSASFTYENVTVQDNREFKVRVGDDLRSNEYLYYREDAYNDGVYGSVVTTTNANPMKFHADKAGNYTFTWFFENDSVAITFPAVDHTNGFYLVGKFGGVDAWNIVDNKLFAYNTGTGDAAEYKIVADVAEGDKFKAIYAKGDAINSWYPDGENNEYVVPASLAGNVTIYFKPAGDNAWTENGGGKKFYVEKNSGTGIDNNVVSDKAVKKIENGMLIIEKNGVRYNILGTQVK